MAGFGVGVEGAEGAGGGEGALGAGEDGAAGAGGFVVSAGGLEELDSALTLTFFVICVIPAEPVVEGGLEAAAIGVFEKMLPEAVVWEEVLEAGEDGKNKV